MNLLEPLAAIAIAAGLVYFAAGAVGLLRFPDIFCRLHALTKADNLGLGLVVLGAILLCGDPMRAAKLLIIWFLVILSSATSGYLIASLACRHDGSKGDDGA